MSSNQEVPCPTCEGDLCLSGDEKKGEEVSCPACNAPAKLLTDADDEDCRVKSDY